MHEANEPSQPNEPDGAAEARPERPGGGNAEHRPIWHGDEPAGSRPTFEPLRDEKRADVAIVGGGITGLSLATLLAREGKRVALLEARRIGAGTTGGTSGHLSTYPDGSYSEIGERFGWDAAREVRASLEAAVDLVEELAGKLGGEEIDAGFRRLPGFLYAETSERAQEVEAAREAAERVGLPATPVDALPLPVPVAAALRVERQGCLHALRYVRGLARRLAAEGHALHEESRVREWESVDGEVRVRTDEGEVRAEALVLATHTPLGRSPLHLRVAPYRSYVAAFEHDGAAPDVLAWDSASPYRYTRRFGAPGGEGAGGRLVVGGADHKTGELEEGDPSGRDPFGALEGYLRERYRGVRVTHRWSSQYYQSSDRLPFIGPSPRPDDRGVYVATGYGGDGLVFGSVAALVLRDLLAGRDGPWRDLYAPGRVALGAGAGRLVSENVDVARRFLADRFRSDAADVAAVPPGEGRVLERDGARAAVYRAPNGETVIRSAVCPHLGCIVRWNPVEASWDCPCHGARYAPGGAVLVGPQTSGLAGDPADDPEDDPEDGSDDSAGGPGHDAGEEGDGPGAPKR